MPDLTALTVRRLVAVETVAAVMPIPGADAIEAVKVRGWTVVTRRGELAAGDLCVFFEIDSALPLTDPRFAFLAARGAKTLPDGTSVHPLKTARLRGVYSQGLAMPLALFPELAGVEDGTDLAALVGVVKWDPPLPAGQGGEIIGPFPTALARKTDAERVQNLTGVWDEIVTAGRWVATEKLDGTSMTAVKDHDGRLRVCGRNWEIAEGDNLYWRAARGHDLDGNLLPGEGVQCELYGKGVQGNPLAHAGQQVAVFAFLRDGRHAPRSAWPTWASALAAPVYPDLELPGGAADAVAQADGLRSLITPARLAEGVVWHHADAVPLACLDGRSCFKAVSNRYLLKHDG